MLRALFYVLAALFGAWILIHPSNDDLWGESSRTGLALAQKRGLAGLRSSPQPGTYFVFEETWEERFHRNQTKRRKRYRLAKVVSSNLKEVKLRLSRFAGSTAEQVLVSCPAEVFPSKTAGSCFLKSEFRVSRKAFETFPVTRILSSN